MFISEWIRPTQSENSAIKSTGFTILRVFIDLYKIWIYITYSNYSTTIWWNRRCTALVNNEMPHTDQKFAIIDIIFFKILSQEAAKMLGVFLAICGARLLNNWFLADILFRNGSNIFSRVGEYDFQFFFRKFW